MPKSVTRLAIIAGTAFLAMVGIAQAAEDLIVQYDQAQLLPLDQPAANIIIGNPSIADVTLKSTKLLVVTGKTFGVTNLMILNDDDKVIYSSRLLVRADDAKVVTLSRGDDRYTYACMPKCEPVLKVGDEGKFYQGIAQSAQQKMKLSEGGAEAQQGGN